MAEELKRPGGELATRPLHFIWVVDCSGSMMGEKIGTVNHAIQSTIPEMVSAAKNNPNAQLLVRTLKFSTGATWVTTSPVPVDDFAWDDLQAGGVTDLGKAFELLAAQLTIPPMSDRALPPVLVLLSDGQPTDDYKKPLDDLKHLPWGKKAVKIAISIGQDADDGVLKEFTGNSELVLQANNPQALVKMIKWASTAASAVSAPASRSIEERPQGAAFAPDASDPSASLSGTAGDASAGTGIGGFAAGTAATGSAAAPSSTASGANYPAATSQGPLVIDLDSIPEINENDVW
ncbi:MAG: VWA domain-containing protein [Coriobacteriales bacterium]|nr:VWA domain-containing protein [Coriobacteriales bacterium]